MTRSVLSKHERARGMTLVEAVVAGVLVALVLIAVVVMIAGGAQRARERERSRNRLRAATAVRGIHQSMVIYAQSNNMWLPGLDSNGNVIPDGPATLHSGPGSSTAARFAFLLNAQYLTGEILLRAPYEDPGKTLWTGGPVTTRHYSFAALALAGNPSDAGRRAEWRDNANSQAVMLSDRHVGSAADSQITSLQSSTPGKWVGVAVWGDNHTEGVRSHRLPTTRYGKVTNTLDNLFADGDNNPAGASDPQATPGYNALMVYE